MIDSKRVIIGSESNQDRKIDLDSLGSKVTVPVSLYDSSGNQISTFSTVSAGFSTFGDGTTTVTTAGTRVALSSSTTVKKVIVQAHESNTGTIVVGSSTNVGALSGRRGLAIYPSQSVEILAANLASIYIDGTVSGDKVHFIYYN